MGSSPISGTSLLKLRSLSDFFTYFFDLTPRRFYYLFILIMLRLSQYVHIKKTKKQKNSIGGGATLYQNKKSMSLKFILACRAHYIPFLIFSLFTTLLGSSLVITSQYNTFAAPGAPSASPIITVSSDPSVDFNFTQTELASSTFKHSSSLIDVYTNNSTGATAYISSIDEDTNLNHSDPSALQKIPSIITPLADAAFNSKTWGYRAAPGSPTGDYHPIPKASTPDTLFNKNSAFRIKHFIDFGVKAGPDLLAGNYSKQIIFTVISNYVPTTATFIPGPLFYKKVHSVHPSLDAEVFKRATTAPTNLASAQVVSTADSALPIYLWYDSTSKTILWWSDADITYANEDASRMFSEINVGVKDVQLIDITGINTSKTKNMSRMFHTGPKLVKKINITDLDTSSAEDMSYMFASDKDIAYPINVDPIDFSHINTSRVKNMAGIFHGSHLPSIDVHHFDTSQVTDLSFAFARLKNVTSLDLSGWNTRNVTSMNSTFVYSENITDLNVSGWQNDSATDMAAMFGRLTKLNNFQHTGFTTKSAVNMEFMFSHCHALTNLDLREFDTSNVTHMKYMFEEMTHLSHIDVSSFRTHNVVDMSFMFSHWSAVPVLQTLDLSNFDTSNVVTMEAMFQDQSNLTSLNVSSFDTRKVTNMKNMFLSTMKNPGNGTLDISSFDTRSLTEAEAMFTNAGMKTILVSPSFTVAGLTTSPQKMFEHTSNIVGGNGTAYVWPNYNSDYAHIDTPGNPGYFTQK